MCVISSIIFHKMFVTKHNEQNEKLERSETIAKMVTERLEDYREIYRGCLMKTSLRGDRSWEVIITSKSLQVDF